MAARLRKTHQEDVKAWKWYVYQFFAGDKCVYVGKGCGKRFNVQCSRFNGYHGYITAYFRLEEDALLHEKALIIRLAPPFNKALMPKKPEPWKFRLLPDDKDFYAWCAAIGTKAISARILLAYRHLVDPSKLDRIRQVAYGHG